MKIKNIMAVGLSLFVLASCSKDSQPVNVEDLKDATLDIKVKASAPGSSLKVGGDENALEGETNINNIYSRRLANFGRSLLDGRYVCFRWRGHRIERPDKSDKCHDSHFSQCPCERF